LVLEDALAPMQRQLLKTWLGENTTGDEWIRAGTPKGWIVGDKTGTCGHYGATNDVGIIWPKDKAPIVIAVYFTGNKENATARPDVIAKATRIILNAMNNAE
jgi:beta-lactamase class A